MHCRTSIKRQT